MASPADPSAEKDPSDIGSFNLVDILDLKELQQLQDAFALSNQLASTITDASGKPITRPSNHSRVCQIIRSTEAGLSNCMESARWLGEMSSVEKGPVCHACRSIGFIDASAPIIVRGRHVANWLIGQNCVGEVDEARVRRYAVHIGTEPDPLVEAFLSMPKLSREAFQGKLDFLWQMARQISTLGLRGLRLSRLNEDLQNSQEELRRYKDHLENLVDERTRELKQAISEIQWMSQTDTLLGCFNRRYLNENLPREIQRSYRYRREMAIVLCDIDCFKTVNDRFGHQFGDRVLMEFVNAVQASIRQYADWLARYGGEEFILVMPETDIHAAGIAAERLRHNVQKLRIQRRGRLIRVSASFGVTGIGADDKRKGLRAEDLINSADNYLYDAKNAGRNRVVSGPPLPLPSRSSRLLSE
ncbi:MAG: diguanylate cyclase [Desulfobacterales bacterium]|jgi:diguanylate cyclase (GGDEF)-like protein